MELPPRRSVGEAAWSDGRRTGGLLYHTSSSAVRPGVRINRPSHVLKRIDTATQIASGPETTKRKPENRHFGLFILSLILPVFILGLMATAEFSPRTSGLLASGIGVLALAISASARACGANLSYALAVSSASLALGYALWQGLSLLGLSNQADVFAAGLCGLALLMAWLWKSPYFLNLSALMIIVWGGLSLLAGQFSSLGWLFPALWAVQMSLAFSFHIRRCIILGATAGVLWIGISALLTL